MSFAGFCIIEFYILQQGVSIKDLNWLSSTVSRTIYSFKFELYDKNIVNIYLLL